MIKISFIVIGYNVEKYIDKCLRSILIQSNNETEIIYVDDGSIDSSFDIVKSLVAKGNKVKLIKQCNSGANSARKCGFLHSKGKYIFFIDGDDFICPDKVGLALRAAESQELDILCFNHYAIHTNNRLLDTRVSNSNVNKPYLDLILSQEMRHEFWNKLYKREFLIESGFDGIKDITMGDDLVANVILGLNNPKFNVIDDAIYNYVYREESVTKKSSEKVLEIIVALNEIEKVLSKKEMIYKYKKELDFLWFFHCYYSRVISIPYKRTEIEKKIYNHWKCKCINFKNNIYIMRYIKKISIKKKIKILAFNISYKLGEYIFN